MTLIRKSVTPAAVAANRGNSRKSIGPRTGRGKRRSSRNAEKHLVFAEIVPNRLVEFGESVAKFGQLRRSLHEAFDPQDGFERELVEGMVGIRWRLSRLHRAEVGMLAAHRGIFRVRYRLSATRKKAGVDVPGEAETKQLGALGFAGAADSVSECQDILDGLRSAQQEVKKGIFSEDTLESLRVIFGNDPSMKPRFLLSEYEECCSHPEGGKSKDLRETRAVVLGEIEARIANFEEILHLIEEREFQVEPSVEEARLLLGAENVDRIVRYESHLERLFERKLQQLVAWRRVKAEGSESKEGEAQKWNKGEGSPRKAS